MTIPLDQKSSIQEIKTRFDEDVVRFSNLEHGHTALVDSPLSMQLVTQAAVKSTPNIRRVLDIGCGAGNNTLKLLQAASPIDCDLLDLSLPMLEKAHQRISAINTGKIRIHQGDFRTAQLPEESYDVILAAAVLHHLRDDTDWEDTFSKIYRLTAPGGSIWITDLVSHETEAVQQMMRQSYAEYLESMGGESFRKTVFESIEIEDSPRPLTYQLDLLRHAGFQQVEILHKNSCFATFGAIKSG
jgi:tRNA (cmo5U34)-methyltransferase